MQLSTLRACRRDRASEKMVYIWGTLLALAAKTLRMQVASKNRAQMNKSLHDFGQFGRLKQTFSLFSR
jgi:hypothetical protein